MWTVLSGYHLKVQLNFRREVEERETPAEFLFSQPGKFDLKFYFPED